MNRIEKKMQALENAQEKELEGEIVSLLDSQRPDHIPADVWELIKENGRLATEKLNDLLNSTRFHRLKVSEQAKLIQLAQDRAYGKPNPGIKQSVKTHLVITDATAQALESQAKRAALPEYRRIASEPSASGNSDNQLRELGSGHRRNLN